MKIIPNTIGERLYKLCLEIEKLPASEQQTKVSVECSAIAEKVAELEAAVALVKPFLTCHTNIGYNQDPHYVQKALDAFPK